MKGFSFNIKLQYKFLALIAGIVLLLGLFAAFITKSLVNQKLTMEIQEKGIFMSKHLAELSAEHILADQLLRLQKNAQHLKMDDNDISYVFVEDAQGNVLTHTFNNGFPAELKQINAPGPGQEYSLHPFVSKGVTIYDIAAPMQDNLGVAHIGISESFIMGSINDIFLSIVKQIAGVLIIGCLLAIIYARRLTRPIFDLINTAKEIGLGNLDHKATISSNDELGQLGMTFNKMVEELRNTTVSRDYLSQVLSSMTDIVLIVDKDSKITMVNRSAESLLGYSREDLIGNPYNVLCANREGVCTNIKTLYDESSTGNIETFFKTKDGTDIAVILTASPLNAGSASGPIVIVAKDNTEFRNTKTELIENQQLLAGEHEKLNTLFGKVALAKREWELTMDCVGDMIILTGEDGLIKRINKPVKEFANRPYTEIIGISWEILIQQQGLESHTFYSGGVEFFQKATGKWYLLNSYPFNSEDLGYSGTVITLHETTEIKHVSQKLEETTRRIEVDREKLRNALEQISLLIQNVTYQKNYNITFTNPHLGKCYEVKNCGKENCPCYGKEAVRCWQVAGTFCGGKIQGAFAQKYQNCAECRVFKDATTDPIYQIGEQFNNMMHVLEIKNRQLEDAYSELKATQAQILQREKMASIGQLAAGVAHEINNPMGFISSNLGTLEKYLVKLTEFITAQVAVTESFKSAETSAQIKDLRKKLKIDYILDDIHQLINESLDGADRVKKIVQNLKSFSRVDEAEYKYTDINECIESTLNIVWNELKYKATVTKEYGELPPTKCYPQQLNQVFMNILVNAAHAIEKQGEIQIRTWNGDGFIKISISDTGSGIPEDKITKIFEPFFTTKPVGKGTGLGLSITYDIVKKHNGEIAVDSAVGKGTTFTVKIPVVIEEKKA